MWLYNNVRDAKKFSGLDRGRPREDYPCGSTTTYALTPIVNLMVCSGALPQYDLTLLNLFSRSQTNKQWL
jgi:hypothetical protein